MPAYSGAGSELVQHFRRRGVIVLSPHFDDACFSLGAFLQAVGHGDLVNLFTFGRYLVAPDLAREWFSEAAIHRIRNEEDDAFARRARLLRHDLECEEPVLRGRRPNQLQGVADDVGQLEQRLLALLDRLARDCGGRPALFAPLGAGGHVNHRAAAEVVYRNLARLKEMFDLYFYEELPYAANLIHRRLALAALRRRAGAVRRRVFPTDWAAKKSLIELYPSQLKKTPRRRRYRPAALLPLAMHEAFWSLADNNNKGQ